jgi:hypothetical protein
MKVAVTSTVLFEVPAGTTIERIARDFRRANEIAIGHPMRTVTGQTYTMLAIERLDVRRVDGPPSFTCPHCGRTSYNPNDIAQRYCGACHQFLDS